LKINQLPGQMTRRLKPALLAEIQPVSRRIREQGEDHEKGF
jgi:hypothetical protein